MSRLSRLLEEAEEALGEARFEDAERACRRALEQDPRHVEAHFLLAEALRDQGRLEEAEGEYRFVVLNAPDHSDAWASLAAVLLELLRWEEARRAANRALREDPEHPEGAWVRGLLRERRGDYAGAERDFHRAHRADPSFAMPVPLDDATVEEVTAEAVKTLHPTLVEFMANVPIMLEEVPDEELLKSMDPPGSPAGILGYFSGHSLRERSVENPWSNLPGVIVLFRRNLQRVAHTREQLLEELRITLFHEVGHFLGLDEDDLEERGLD